MSQLISPGIPQNYSNGYPTIPGTSSPLQMNSFDLHVQQQQQQQQNPQQPSQQYLTQMVNSIAPMISSNPEYIPPYSTNMSNMSYPNALPLQYPTIPLPSLTNPPNQGLSMYALQPPPQQQQQSQPVQMGSSYPPYPHAQLQSQLRDLQQLSSTWEAPSTNSVDPNETETEDDECNDSLLKQEAKESKNNSFRKQESNDTFKKDRKKKVLVKGKSGDESKDTPKEGTRLQKQRDEIQKVIKTCTDPLRTLIQTLETRIPCVSTYPNADQHLLSYYLPVGSDTSKEGMTRENRNPIYPYVFFRSLYEDMEHLYESTFQQVREGFSKYVNKYRHRHVNNRRKHLNTDLQVSSFPKSPSQLHYEQQRIAQQQQQQPQNGSSIEGKEKASKPQRKRRRCSSSSSL